MAIVCLFGVIQGIPSLPSRNVPYIDPVVLCSPVAWISKLLWLKS